MESGSWVGLAMEEFYRIHTMQLCGIYVDILIHVHVHIERAFILIY